MNHSKTRNIVLIGFFSALVGISSYFSIPLPFGPVPLTLQTLFVMLVGLVLPVCQSSTSIGVFIFLGIIGIPVFAGGQSGIGVILGPTGGYILGFMVGASVIGMLVKCFPENIWGLFFSAVIGGIGVVHLFGIPWLAVSTGMSLLEAFFAGTFPFLIGDCIKAIVAVAIAVPLRKHLRQMNFL